MFTHKLSNLLASKISAALKLDKDREEVLAYGAFGIIQTLWSIILIAAFGAVFNVLLEALAISFAAAVLRKYSGGVHATSPNRCALIGAVAFGGLGLMLSRSIVYLNTTGMIIYCTAGFAFSYCIIYRYAPVDTPNKPIKKESTRQRLRKRSFIALHASLGLAALSMMIYTKTGSEILIKLTASMCAGIVWQSLTLTPIGHFIISRLDIVLKNTALMIGGEKK